ncbi:MAG: hypothetical protein ACLSAP_13040 [Oscillospiraceae bacterium]
MASIGHIAEARILEALKIDYIDERYSPCRRPLSPQ